MRPKLVDLNDDLIRLWDEGYELEVKGTYLLIHKVPYLNSNRDILLGTLLTNMSLNGQLTIRPVADHVAYFIGEQPCDEDGIALTHIIGSNKQALTEDITIDQTLSSKPKVYDLDYYAKIKRYVTLISSPAEFYKPEVSAKTFRVMQSTEPDSVLHYLDTNASESKIYSLSSLFKNHKVGIIGLGGTGSYILDLIVKTPVEEIHLFDGDKFLQKNAFRAPGAPSIDKLKEQLYKTEYYREIYSNMHKNIFANTEYITPQNLEKLSDLNFVFICMDSGQIKPHIINFLFQHNIKFLDVGMGIVKNEEQVAGQIRVTTGTEQTADLIGECIPFTEEQDNEYSRNIQIAELNSLNASLAVIKWKKLLGFYHDLGNEFNSIYNIRTNRIINDEIGNQVC